MCKILTPKEKESLNKLIKLVEGLTNKKIVLESKPDCHCCKDKKQQLKEGVWALPKDAVARRKAMNFKQELQRIKNDIYDIAGSDKLFDNLDGAIKELDNLITAGKSQGKKQVLENIIPNREKYKGKEMSDGQMIIKNYPYRFSLKKIQSKIREVRERFQILSSVIEERNYEIGYSTGLYTNSEQTIAYFFYIQRSTTFYDQFTIGFKDKKQALEFKSWLSKYK